MSICTRCGKERVAVSTKKEKVGNSVITYTTTVCPNPLCQKLVNDDIKKDQIKRNIMNEERERRVLQRAAFKINNS